MAGRLTKRVGRIHKTSVGIGGGVGVILGLFPRLAMGNPLPVLHVTEAEGAIPPLWLMGTLWLLVWGSQGAAVGHLLTCPPKGGMEQARLWRGMTFLVVEMGFSFAWYRLFFGALLALPAWLCLWGAVASAGLRFLSWGGLRRTVGVIALVGGVWHLWLLLLQTTVILHN